MGEKVILTKEAAEAIEKYIDVKTRERAVAIRARSNCEFVGEFSVLNDIPLDIFCEALYTGYEVEQTAEEKALEHYKSHRELLSFYRNKLLDHAEREQERFSCGYVSGVRDFAKAYGIKIEGVTAE